MAEQTKAEEAKRQSRGWDDAMDSASIAEAIGEIGGALRVLENASRKQKIVAVGGVVMEKGAL